MDVGFTMSAAAVNQDRRINIVVVSVKKNGCKYKKIKWSI